jgi:hypothetical protein
VSGLILDRDLAQKQHAHCDSAVKDQEPKEL